MRSDELVAAIRQAAFIGDAGAYPEYPDAKLMDEATKRLHTVFQDIVVKARNGYWLKEHVYTTTPCVAAYRMPPRAVVGGLEKVWIAPSACGPYTGLEEVPASAIERYRSYAGTTGPIVYAWVGDQIELLPAPSTAISLKISYYLRPSKLVTSQSSTQGGANVVRGQVIYSDPVTRQISVNVIPFDYSLSVPAALTSGLQSIDVVRPDGWHEVVLVGAPQTYGLGNIFVIGGDQDMSRVQPGDFVRCALQTDWPALPEDFHQALADATAIKILLQMKLKDKATDLAEVNNGDLSRFRSLLLPRTKAEPKTIGISPKAARGLGPRVFVASGGGGSTCGPCAAGGGGGDIVPFEMPLIAGAPFTLVKNWDFGTDGNIGNYAQLDAEFNYHDVYGTYNLGGKYGTNTVASSVSTALPGQEIDPGTKFREFTANSILCHVKPFVDGNNVGPAALHNGGNGSIHPKLVWPDGLGSNYGKDFCTEIRFRIEKQEAGLWFAFWLAGVVWDDGPEIDTLESFAPYPEFLDGAWHSNIVGPLGTESIDYWSSSWFAGQIEAGYPQDGSPPANSLRNWHTLTLCYRKDNRYECYMDHVRIQSGTYQWRVPNLPGEPPTNARLMLDLSALHTDITDNNYDDYVIPNADIPITYEIDYWRVWERD